MTDTEMIREAHELAGAVLEAMSQDSGPADCEPFTGWCVDLARALLSALERERALMEALRQIESHRYHSSLAEDCRRVMIAQAHAALAGSMAGFCGRGRKEQG